jgi:hypothetical protein
MEVHNEVRELQVSPVAGVWACGHCGRRIQVITASDHPKVQAFTCVCGTAMAPGEEHSAVGEETPDRVVDD